MGKDLLKYFGAFVLLIFLQLFLFNNIQLSGYINPYVYVLFILLLPYSTPGWLLLVLGFATGLIMDTFMNTFGMHSSATLLLAFLRPYMLSLITDRDDTDRKGSPIRVSSGFVWLIKYTVFLVLAHHILLFMIESFTLSTFFSSLWRAIVSTLATSTFIVLGIYFTLRK